MPSVTADTGYDPRDLWSIPFNAPLSPPYPIVYGDIRIMSAHATFELQPGTVVLDLLT